MGFMDKVKATVKSGAEQAATKAQDEYERMQTRRELSQVVRIATRLRRGEALFEES